MHVVVQPKLAKATKYQLTNFINGIIFVFIIVIIIIIIIIVAAVMI